MSRSARMMATSSARRRNSGVSWGRPAQTPPASIAGVRRKTALGFPAAAQISAYCCRSRSMKVFTGLMWPTGATPPMAKPVSARTKSASARPSTSPAVAAMCFSSTRLVPLASTRIASPVSSPRKTSDLTIWETVQPMASAASCAVRVLASSSTASSARPEAASAALTRSMLEVLAPASLMPRFPFPHSAEIPLAAGAIGFPPPAAFGYR